MTKIHTKYTPKYNTELKRLSLILNGTETDDTKKKSKQLEKLLDDVQKLDSEKKEKETAVQAKVDEKKETENITPTIKIVQREKAWFTTAQTTPTGN